MKTQSIDDLFVGLVPDGHKEFENFLIANLSQAWEAVASAEISRTMQLAADPCVKVDCLQLGHLQSHQVVLRFRVFVDGWIQPVYCLVGKEPVAYNSRWERMVFEACVTLLAHCWNNESRERKISIGPESWLE
ncbi:MAG: hypothetical protein P4L74_03915 [Candidatus Doudnabacteria bacterium]|nr:hypothetical protein [Candidatus Doudnabacteria bacterium]